MNDKKIKVEYIYITAAIQLKLKNTLWSSTISRVILSFLTSL